MEPLRRRIKDPVDGISERYRRMKYYDEAQMAAVRKSLEAEVLQWRGVSTKEMMGCLCYFYGTKFFAFLVTNGIVITKLSREDRTRLSNDMSGKPFEMAGRTIKVWVKISVKEPKDARAILPFVRKSYENAVEVRSHL